MAKEQNGNFEAQLFKAADKLRKNIDAAETGFLKDRVHREFTDKDMDKISETYRKWKCGDAKCGDAKCGDAKCGDAKCGDAKCGDAKCGDAKCGDAKCGDAKCGDAKCGDAKCGDAKCGDAKCGDAKYCVSTG